MKTLEQIESELKAKGFKSEEELDLFLVGDGITDKEVKLLCDTYGDTIENFVAKRLWNKWQKEETPTLEEVKEHFKDAKVVKCLDSNKEFTYHLTGGEHCIHKVWLDCLGNFLYKNGKWAEIVEYKEEEKEQKKYTVLVKYNFVADSGHALLDDVHYKKSQIIQVDDLLELNDMFKAILDVKILEKSVN